tara:strand:- start:506 stop:1141 length:636 start_codon:yes stop_codon:yes gene_type:complete
MQWRKDVSDDVSREDLQRQIEKMTKQLQANGIENEDDMCFVESDGHKNYDKNPNGKYKRGKSPALKAEQAKWADPANRPKGGRPKGSKNKKTLRQELVDNGMLTPAEFLASVMNDEEQNMKIRLRAAESAAPYYDAKLSSIEMHTDEENVSPFNIIMATGNNPVLLANTMTVCNTCGTSPCKCGDLEALEDASNEDLLEHKSDEEIEDNDD